MVANGPIRMPGSRGTAGFTFLELVVVMTLIAIISAMVVPIYAGSMGALQMRSSRNDMMSLLTFLQQRAVSDCREYRLHIGEDNGAYYRWVGYRTVDEEEVPYTEEVTEEWGRFKYFPEWLEVDPSSKLRSDRELKDDYIACFPSGVSDRVTLNLVDRRRNERGLRIKVLGSIGKFEVKE